jgi:cation diffusion facilitator CzcD-associated flavoprotein CzcO
MNAIQEPNVDVHFSAVDRVTEDSVIDTDGNEKKIDTIICATGFDVSYRPRFPIVGQNGVELGEKWKVCPEAYLGVTVPDMPNFITFIGPSVSILLPFPLFAAKVPSESLQYLTLQFPWCLLYTSSSKAIWGEGMLTLLHPV